MDKDILMSAVTIVSNEDCERCVEVKSEITEFFPNIEVEVVLFKSLEKDMRRSVRDVLNRKKTTLPAFILKDGSVYNGTYREFLKEIRYI